MKTTFENIKTKANEFIKTDKARIGGACICALLICVGVGFGVNAISSLNAQNLPSKALENTVSENTKTESENTEKSSENATEQTDEVTVNDKGEVVDEKGNVVAESVEAYNATQNSQSRPVNISNGSNSVTYTEVTNTSTLNLGERVEGNTNYGHYERQPYEVKVEDGHWEYVDGGECVQCSWKSTGGSQAFLEHAQQTGHGHNRSCQIPTGRWIDDSYTYLEYKNVWVWDR